MQTAEKKKTPLKKNGCYVNTTMLLATSTNEENRAASSNTHHIASIQRPSLAI